ncbi:hypothetical protein Drorol1_Dr00009122 [Drosera rotundifolia]
MQSITIPFFGSIPDPSPFSHPTLPPFHHPLHLLLLHSPTSKSLLCITSFTPKNFRSRPLPPPPPAPPRPPFPPENFRSRPPPSPPSPPLAPAPTPLPHPIPLHPETPPLPVPLLHFTPLVFPSLKILSPPFDVRPEQFRPQSKLSKFEGLLS